jgi:pimeloyl-ACP methyl ester carboxylesterase
MTKLSTEIRRMYTHKTSAIRCLALLLALFCSPPGTAAQPEGAWGSERKTVMLANGMQMGYVELGDPGKPPLVFLHGFTNSSLGYLPLGRLLAQHHRVFLVDQRGHGESSKPPCCYTRLDLAHDAKLFMDHFGLQRAHIAGHSLGGMVAQTLAAFWPERVDRLMVIGSTIGRRSLPSRDSPRPPPTFDRPRLGVHEDLVGSAGTRSADPVPHAP